MKQERRDGEEEEEEEMKPKSEWREWIGKSVVVVVTQGITGVYIERSL